MAISLQALSFDFHFFW